MGEAPIANLERFFDDGEGLVFKHKRNGNRRKLDKDHLKWGAKKAA